MKVKVELDTNKTKDWVLTKIKNTHNYVENLPNSTKFLVILLIAVLFFNAKDIKRINKEKIDKEVQVLSSIPVSNQEVETKIESETENFISLNTIPITLFQSKKIISITEIIKDKKVLNFLSHNETLKRAYNASQLTGFNLVTVIAQKGHESGWNSSSLCDVTKNLGNIKCPNQSCKKYNIPLKRKGQIGHIGNHCVQLWDDAPSDRFVKFDNYYEGWEKYVNLINNRYKRAAKQKGWMSEIIVLGKSGYATDRKYSNILIGIVKDKELLKLQYYINEGYTITTDGGKYILYEP